MMLVLDVNHFCRQGLPMLASATTIILFLMMYGMLGAFYFIIQLIPHGYITTYTSYLWTILLLGAFFLASFLAQWANHLNKKLTGIGSLGGLAVLVPSFIFLVIWGYNASEPLNAVFFNEFMYLLMAPLFYRFILLIIFLLAFLISFFILIGILLIIYIYILRK